jgi:hypothetical protein
MLKINALFLMNALINATRMVTVRTDAVIAELDSQELHANKLVEATDITLHVLINAQQTHLLRI